MGVKTVIDVPLELKSPNTWQGRHWRYKHRESQMWEEAIWTLCALVMKPRRICEVKRRVTVTRFVPSARNFIRDDDNLRFATKPLNDALKRLGLIKNDSRNWLEQPMPEQVVSVVKGYGTRLVIEDIPESSS
jgi:Holliday junction resolvase RusA-like endonuclease